MAGLLGWPMEMASVLSSRQLSPQMYFRGGGQTSKLRVLSGSFWDVWVSGDTLFSAHQEGSHLPKPCSNLVTLILLVFKPAVCTGATLSSARPLTPQSLAPTLHLSCSFFSFPQRTQLSCCLSPTPAHTTVMEMVRQQTLRSGPVGTSVPHLQWHCCSGKRDIICRAPCSKSKEKSIIKALKYKAFPFFHGLYLSSLVMVFFLPAIGCHFK